MKKGVLYIVLFLSLLHAALAINIGTCTTLSTTGGSYNLTANVTTTASCMSITASDITLNCTGNSITFDTGAGTNSNGITATSVNNITITGCLIIDGSSTGSVGSAIRFTNVENSTIRDNTLMPSGGSAIGVRLLTGSSFNTVENNTITTSGSSPTYGVNFASAIGNLVRNNDITASGSGGTNIGVSISQDNHNNTVFNNTIRTDGANNNRGINLANTGTGNVLAWNTITTNGTGTQNMGIYITNRLNDTRIENNTIHTGGDSQENYGIRVDGFSSSANHNTIKGNTVTTTGTLRNHAIFLEAGALNNTCTDNTLRVGGTDGFYFRIDQSDNNTFSSNTFETLDNVFNVTGSQGNTVSALSINSTSGTLSFLQSFALTNTRVTSEDILLTNNNIFVNTSKHSFLNVTSRVTLQNITFTNPKIQVDYDDDGTFADCDPPECNQESYSGGIFIFNVSHFTTFQTQETPAAPVPEFTDWALIITLLGGLAGTAIVRSQA